MFPVLIRDKTAICGGGGKRMHEKNIKIYMYLSTTGSSAPRPGRTPTPTTTFGWTLPVRTSPGPPPRPTTGSPGSTSPPGTTARPGGSSTCTSTRLNSRVRWTHKQVDMDNTLKIRDESCAGNEETSVFNFFMRFFLYCMQV